MAEIVLQLEDGIVATDSLERKQAVSLLYNSIRGLDQALHVAWHKDKRVVAYVEEDNFRLRIVHSSDNMMGETEKNVFAGVDALHVYCKSDSVKGFTTQSISSFDSLGSGYAYEKVFEGMTAVLAEM